MKRLIADHPYFAEWGVEQMRANIDARTEQVLDARAAGRFKGADPEPRPECRSGHWL